MSQIVLFDETLKQAAASVRQSMLDSLPLPSQCEHEFSPDFQAKMKRMIAQHELRRKAHKAMQRAAIFLLVALIGVSAWLTVDAQAREAFFTWVREVYKEHIVYRFFGEPAAESLPVYRITWLPEGYEEIDVYSNDNLFSVLYQKGDDTTDAFVFEYYFMQDGGLTELLFFDDEDYNYKVIDINGVHADFYETELPGETNNLIWIDENAGIIFTLNGFLKESIMIHIAESVLLTN